MLEKIKNWVREHRLLIPGDRVLAACSGGPDSVALVHILIRLREEIPFLLSVAHVDHMLRGRESEEDAEFVAALCDEWQLPLYQTQVPVERFRQANRLSLEEAARILRFQFLREQALVLGCRSIATGHHADDQSETVLLNFLRGAGSQGLKGMRPRDGVIIRPLLCVNRPAIEAYCREQGLEARTDSSNMETDYLRNQIRLKLLPCLEKEYNANLRQTLWRMSQIAADEYEYIRFQSEQAGAVERQADRQIWLDRDVIRKAAPAIRRGIIRLAVEKCKGNLKGISFEHVEMLVQMAVEGRVGTIRPLPGRLEARVEYQSLWFGPARKEVLAGRIEPPGIELQVPGTTVVDALGMEIRAEYVISGKPRTPWEAFFDGEDLQLPIFVRTRSDGDRFQPIGMSGTKKVKDFFVDAKIPREIRDKTAIIADQRGILWIVGHRQADRGKIKAHSSRFLRLSVVQGEQTGK